MLSHKSKLKRQNMHNHTWDKLTVTTRPSCPRMSLASQVLDKWVKEGRWTHTPMIIEFFLIWFPCLTSGIYLVSTDNTIQLQNCWIYAVRSCNSWLAMHMTKYFQGTELDYRYRATPFSAINTDSKLVYCIHISTLYDSSIKQVLWLAEIS